MEVNKRKNQAFTLVELAIVLVIIGLIVGGVLVGQDMIKASEVRATVKQIEFTNAAVNTFREKYKAIPGDMSNATAYWGAADADPNTCLSTVRTGTATCNGSGNGLISRWEEVHLFWQHLENAGLIGQRFQGGDCFVADMNPEDFWLKTKLAAVWMAASAASTSTFSAALGGNVIILGGPGDDCTPVGPQLLPQDAYNVDAKIDDGKPKTGTVIVEQDFFSADSCADSSTPQNYDVNNPDNRCALVVRTSF